MSRDAQTKAYICDCLCREQQVLFLAVVNKLDFLWRKIGFNEKEIIEKFNDVLERYEMINDDLLKDNENMINNLSCSVKEHELELQQLCSELEIEAKEVNLNLPFLQKEKNILAQLDELKQLIHNQMEQYKKLRNDEDDLCNFLKMSKIVDISSTIPKLHHLHELKEYIKRLTDIKKRRISEYNYFRGKLLKLLDETDFAPENSIELDVEVDALTELSQKKLDRMKENLEKGQEFQQKTTEKISELLKKIMSLWNDLNIDENLRRDFTKAHSQIRQSTIHAIKSEIKSCEQQIIIRDIKNLREQLVELWDNCFISDEVKEQFESFHRQEYDEDLLQVHIAEVDRLIKYYVSAKAIFKKIIKRQGLWEKAMTFEKQSRDPSRFTNRGGTLLKEEKQRKGLMKELQRLDDDIIHDIEEREGKNCIPVLVNGIDYRTYIFIKWEEQAIHPKKQAKDLPSQRTPHGKHFTRNPASAPAKLISAEPFARIPSSDKSTSSKPFSRIPSLNKLTSSKPTASISSSDKLQSSPISSKRYVAFPLSRNGSMRKKTTHPALLH